MRGVSRDAELLTAIRAGDGATALIQNFTGSELQDHLDADGGIEIYVAAEQPAGIPEENWLAVSRQDENLNIILRIYVPDMEQFKTWSAPTAKIVAK